jgi:hypothetical protein
MIELLEGQLSYCRYEADKYFVASEEGYLTTKYHQGRGIQYRLGPKRGFAITAAEALSRELEFRMHLIKLRYCE